MAELLDPGDYYIFLDENLTFVGYNLMYAWYVNEFIKVERNDILSLWVESEGLVFEYVKLTLCC